MDGHTFEKQYKEVLSSHREWDQLEHADQWLLFADNLGPCLAIAVQWRAVYICNEP